MKETVLYQSEDNVGHIVFNRATDMNAYNVAMSSDLPAAVLAAKEDNSVRVVVLEANGPVFMAGGDVNYFYENRGDKLPSQIPFLARALNAAVYDLQTMEKPVIAKVHGAVAGAGLSLMLAADLVIAEKSTVFNTAYAQLGLSGDGGITYQLPRTVGVKKAIELMYLAEKFSAEKALELGLINYSVGKDEFELLSAQLIQRLKQGPTKALSAIKKCIQSSADNSLAKQLELEVKEITALTKTKDFNTAVGAFIEKQHPEFIGK